jgi:hypothetical protein
MILLTTIAYKNQSPLSITRNTIHKKFCLGYYFESCQFTHDQKLDYCLGKNYNEGLIYNCQRFY